MGLKEVTLQMEGSGQPGRRVELLPGMTVGEALVKAGLDPQENHVMSPGGTRLLDASEDLHRCVDPGEELSVSPAMDAGVVDIAAFLGLVVAASSLLLHRAKPEVRKTTLPVRPRAELQNQRPRKPVQATRASTAAEERWLRRNGWKKCGSVLEGRFRTTFATFVGRMEFADGGYQVYVQHPPEWMFEGEHAACWHQRSGGWYWLHQNSLHKTPAAAARSMESFVVGQYAENKRSA